jgi:hypothetical protein
MRALIPALMLFLAVTGCGRHPISDADKRKYFGDSFIYQGAPFCCIYVGLDTNEATLFDATFWHFADRHDIHKPKKNYTAYSGPPRVTCKSDHVSVFAYSDSTAHITERYYDYRTPIPPEGEQVSWQAGIWWDAYWPTNACRITKDGHEVLAPITGTVRMASNDTNYPLQEFKRLSGALTATLQSAFPDRVVRVFTYDGDTK